MINNRILITGASGCVGQYIVAWLLENSDAELLLLIRDPKKLTAVPLDHPKIKLLIGDLREISDFANELNEVNRVIHTATAWGDPQRAQEVNVVAVKKLLDLLNPLIIEQIIYFSTASILDKELKPLNLLINLNFKNFSSFSKISLYSSVITNNKLIIIVCDNGGHAVINRLQLFKGGKEFNCLFESSRVNNLVGVNFAKHAESMGAKSEEVTTILELEEAFKRAKKAKGTYVISLSLIHI